ncbi:MAG: type II secretion system GspH family protein [Phycisphaerales bacterium]|nr:type II secretion system GspH family protein [Phycisphaerales bacterium]
MTCLIRLIASMIGLAFVVVPAESAVVPFTENFTADAANWYNSASTAPVDWVASGGPDGSSFASTTFNFVNQTPGLPFPNNAVNLFRAQDEFNSSGGAFFGDWIGDGATEFSFWIRHNAPSAMTFFTRFATPDNFPAWSAVEFTPVLPNTWTQISFDIFFGNPELFFEGPPPTQANFNQVFSSIGHVQVGVFGGLQAGIDQVITFDLDQPTLVPTPAGLALLGLAALASGPRRRRTSSFGGDCPSRRRNPSAAIPRDGGPSGRGFSIVELLAVLGAITVLVALMVPTMRSFKSSGQQTVEVNAAKQLMAAYLNYAAASKDMVMPGYASLIPNDATDPNAKVVMAWDAQRRPIEGGTNMPLDIARRRYLWRLAPHMDYNLRGLFTGEHQDLLESLESQDYESYLYKASISPSLGLNTEWVGGDSEAYGFLRVADPLRNYFDFDRYYVRSMSQVLNPGKLLVFASARGFAPENGSQQIVEGYFKVQSPYFVEPDCRWSDTFNSGELPVKYGYVSPRYGGKSVIGFADGHAGLLTKEQIRDMRHWANWATEAAWRLPTLSP